MTDELNVAEVLTGILEAVRERKVPELLRTFRESPRQPNLFA